MQISARAAKVKRLKINLTKSIKSTIAREGLNGIVVSVVSLSQANAGATWPSYCFPRAMAKGSACASSSWCRRKIEKTYQSMSMSLLRPQPPQRSYEVQRGLRTFPRERQRKVLLVCDSEGFCLCGFPSWHSCLGSFFVPGKRREEATRCNVAFVLCPESDGEGFCLCEFLLVS